MTIKEWIIAKELPAYQERLEQLLEIGAPKVVTEFLADTITEMEQGIIQIGGATEKLQHEVRGYEKKTGRGGKVYIEFEDGTRYFPQAKYGRYIA